MTRSDHFCKMVWRGILVRRPQMPPAPGQVVFPGEPIALLSSEESHYRCVRLVLQKNRPFLKSRAWTVAWLGVCFL